MLDQAPLDGSLKLGAGFVVHGNAFSTSCPRLSRASTPLFSNVKTWMAGTSPAMTEETLP
jgi:hypothetical protein